MRSGGAMRSLRRVPNWDRVEALRWPQYQSGWPRALQRPVGSVGFPSPDDSARGLGETPEDRPTRPATILDRAGARLGGGIFRRDWVLRPTRNGTANRRQDV